MGFLWGMTLLISFDVFGLFQIDCENVKNILWTEKIQKWIWIYEHWNQRNRLHASLSHSQKNRRKNSKSPIPCDRKYCIIYTKILWIQFPSAFSENEIQRKILQILLSPSLACNNSCIKQALQSIGGWDSLTNFLIRFLLV